MEPGKIYLELDGYELGQIVALLPDVAWNRMERPLRNRIKAAQAEIEKDRERAAKPRRRKAAIAVAVEPAPADAPIPDDHVPVEPPDLQTLIADDLRGNVNPMPNDDDFFE